MKEVRQVNITLKLLTTKTAMFDFVKDNINIRVEGFVDVKEFSEFRVTFLRKGKNKEVQELATHLKDIIKFENKYIAKNGKPEKPASGSKKSFI